MKLILQFAKNLSVTADGEDRGSIAQGLYVLVGIHKDDTPEITRQMAEKLLRLRIIQDEKERMNLACTDPAAESDLAVISNFTLYADCTKSRRPDFLQSAPYEKAKELYEMFLGYLKLGAEELKAKENKRSPRIISGVFGAHMEISFCACGPITIALDSNEPGLLK